MSSKLGQGEGLVSRQFMLGCWMTCQFHFFSLCPLLLLLPLWLSGKVSALKEADRG